MESAAARAYLGADVTARRAHNTCIVTCALGRVRFEVNDKGINTQHVSRFHDHRIVPTVFSPTSPSVQAHSEPRSGFPPSRCRRTSRASPHSTLTSLFVARRDRRGATAAPAVTTAASRGTPRRPMFRVSPRRGRPPDASRCPPRSRSRRPSGRPGLRHPATRRLSGARSA